MRDKSYQITVDKTYLKRTIDRLSMSVYSHSLYAESKNTNQWDDPISKCLSDDLHNSFEDLEKLIEKIVNTSTEAKK